ncbi:MAG: hypothetical protein HY080_05615 [Gammaproteobacteria bacterium]|nr:hypothetical protein [Gammaproteobacteria bacterium]
MKRRAALLKCEESLEASDRNGYEVKPIAKYTGLIEFKNTPEWKQAYDELKNVLGTRENMPNKMKRKQIRAQKAKRTK